MQLFTEGTLSIVNHRLKSIMCLILLEKEVSLSEKEI